MLSTFRFLASASLAAAFLFTATHSAPAQTYSEQVLYTFCGEGICPESNMPYAGLVQASDGNFYGTTSCCGGGPSVGSVFKLTPSGSLTTLYTFCSDFGACADGSYPFGALVQGTDGNFYGTTQQGGNASGNGTVFKITPSGSLTTLYTFCSQTNCADGSQPYDGLVQGTDGNFYGATTAGGDANGDGTVFKITPSGSLTTLYTFCSQMNCTDGAGPNSGLVQGTDGNFYGTTVLGGNTNNGGTYGNGTVFQITPSGSLTTLYSFCVQTNCTDGDSPDSGLVQGTDGNFYGTTRAGGNDNNSNAQGNGTVFKITSSGSLTTLYNFCSQTGCTDGSVPHANLVLGTDGNFYSTTSEGGNAYQGGTVFKVTSSGSLTTLYSFCTQALCPDGNSPESGLIQGVDGTFYGTTYGGGSYIYDSTSGYGTVYELAVAPVLAGPVQLSLSPGTVPAGTTFSLTYTVTNATSDSLQYCFATNTAGDAVWSGVLTGKATSQTASLTAPSTTGTYTYALTCGGMESGFATLTVTLPATTTTLTAMPNPASIGQSVTLKATVGASSGTPAGLVNFVYNGASIGSAALNSGVAALTASTGTLPVGTYAITAKYGGSSAYAASNSASTLVTLSKAPTATTLSASPNPVTPPTNCTLTATVNRKASGAAGFATGSVTFSVGATPIGTAKLNPSGVATFSASTSGIAAGKYPVTAKYNGDASDVASSSTSTVTVQ
jgi:uncharacterized repeat protein (TIGR03803 family)